MLQNQGSKPEVVTEVVNEVVNGMFFVILVAPGTHSHPHLTQETGFACPTDV